MARVYRRRWGRRRRFVKRRYFRRRFRKTAPKRRIRTLFSKAKRFIRKAAKSSKRHLGYTSLPIESANKRIMRTQNSSVVQISRTSINTTNGHVGIRFSLDDIMSIDDLNYMKNMYYSWQLIALTFTIKIITLRNMWTLTDFGSTLANIHVQDAVPNNRVLPVFLGYFRHPTQYTTCTGTDPDTSVTTLSSLLETNRYKVLPWSGKGITTAWYNTRSYLGTPTDIGTPTGSTQIDTAFAGSIPTYDTLIAADIMIPERNRIHLSSGTGEFIFKLQVCGSAVIQLTGKKPLDF